MHELCSIENGIWKRLKGWEIYMRLYPRHLKNALLLRRALFSPSLLLRDLRFPHYGSCSVDIGRLTIAGHWWRAFSPGVVQLQNSAQKSLLASCHEVTRRGEIKIVENEKPGLMKYWQLDICFVWSVFPFMCSCVDVRHFFFCISKYQYAVVISEFQYLQRS